MINRILITGSSGTVGTALVKKLSALKYKVVPLDIKPSIWDEQINKDTVRHDLRKPLSSKKIKKRPDLIIHLAANARVHDSVVNPSLASDNYLMTSNLLEYARENKIPKLLFASSREVYGESHGGRKKNESNHDIKNLKAPYTASKIGSEALIHSYSACYDINIVIARLSNVYGRYDVSERVIPLFLYYAERDRDLTIFGKEKKLDFTYIDDTINGLTKIVKRFDKVKGETINLASGKSSKLIDVAKFIISQTESNSKIKISSKRTGEISHFTANILRARQLLNYQPKVDINEGLTLSIKWYEQVKKIKKVHNSQRRNLLKRGLA